MNDVDTRAIEVLAAAKSYHGPERAPAIDAFYRGLRNGELDKTPHMRFMSEVDNKCPDLMLRSRYRQDVLKEYAS